jgi:hypothetical protein
MFVKRHHAYDLLHTIFGARLCQRGLSQEARKQFFAKRHDLFEQYRTNDIHGADITLAEIESLDRRDGSIVYSTPMSMDNEMRFCRSAQG